MLIRAICICLCIISLGTYSFSHKEYRCNCVQSYNKRPLPRGIQCVWINHPSAGCERIEAIAYFNYTVRKTPICLDYQTYQRRLPPSPGAWCWLNKTHVSKVHDWDCKWCHRFEPYMGVSY
uniref:Chemokine vCXCL2 n=1 Tax=Simian cytomegalovirus (strain Colburn) TaxID=50292 RepID=D2E2Z0_SCMVC|nr:chemokine vCXCL2 [Cercopithecine betaherpesvirus 5]